MQRLITVIMGQNCEQFIDMCLESVKDSDAIVYCDGGSTEEFINKLFCKYGFMDGSILPKLQYNGITLIQNKFDQEDKGMNGKQRNFYLNYLKEVYPDYWCLVLDADEVCEDINKIKEFIQTAEAGLYSIHMRHFHNDLGHEDSTVEKHWVPNRLFKISEADKYLEVEHPVLMGSKYYQTDITTIWHLAHINHVFSIKKRYEKNIKHSNMHSPEFLDNWKDAHMLGKYPNKEVNVLDIPDVILKNFNIDKDKYYFASRNIEIKHPIQVIQWNNYFKPESVLDLSAGKGPYLYFWKQLKVNSAGIELSQYAVNHAFCNDINQGDVSDENSYPGRFELITAIDILEHLNDEKLNKTLRNMFRFGDKFLFSIPFIGDPNLTNDKTHIQHKTKEEWIKLIGSYGIKIEPTPQDWLFKEQILIGKI